MNKEEIKKEIAEKDAAKLRYKEQLELIKQHYGVEFDIEYFESQDLNKIRFYNLDYKTSAKNISMVYDNKLGKFNYIFYEYDSDSSMKDMSDKRLINGLYREKKLKLIVAEIARLNNDYQKELLEIEEKFKKIEVSNEKIDRELEMKKKVQNS